MTPIVPFYRGEAPDDYGRTIELIWAFSDAQLEYTHNYIQRLFPLYTPSRFADAPLLDDATVQAFHDDPLLRERLLRSLDVMLDFYGLRREGDRIIRAEDFARCAANWLSPHNHNFLRLTRILISVGTLGLPQWARALFACLNKLYEQNRSVIGKTTFVYWQDAVADAD